MIKSFLNIAIMVLVAFVTEAQPVDEFNFSFVVSDAEGNVLDFITKAEERKRKYSTVNTCYWLEAQYVDPQSRKAYSVGSDLFCQENKISNDINWQTTTVNSIIVTVSSKQAEMQIELNELPVVLGTTLTIELPPFVDGNFSLSMNNENVQITSEGDHINIHISDWTKFQTAKTKSY